MDRKRIIGILVATGAGLALSVYAYHRATDSEPARERRLEEAVVLEAREILRRHVALAGEVEIVDPLATNPAAGKAYIYPADGGWQVSGYYRRPPALAWRPWLMTLDEDRALSLLEVRDDEPRIRALAAKDPRFAAEP